MKKRVLALLLMIMSCITLIWGTGTSVQAEELGEDLSFSELVTENALVGAMQMQTRGVYLAEGNSVINKISSTKIGAGGSTIAAVKCKVSITSIVERSSTGTSWARVTSWTSTTTSGYSASLSKSLVVTTGYYYRVRSSHYASTDVSSSWTGALWMGN